MATLTREQLFLKGHHLKLKGNVEKEYLNFINDVREDLKTNFSTDIVDPQFLDQLNDIIHDEAFDRYSPLKFYWMNLVDSIIYLIQLHEEILSADEYNETTEELSEAEDELFNLWNDSDFAKVFLDMLNDGLPVIEASDQLLPILENQIISFYVLNINEFQQEFDDAIVYQAVPEMGDFEKRLYLGDNHKVVELSFISESYPSLPISAILPHKNEVGLVHNEETVIHKIKENDQFLMIDDHKLFVLPNSNLGIKQNKIFIDNIKEALKRIKIAAPHLLEVFKSFTHTIVPVNEEGIVSYSMQSLPGYSSINMFERDQIDLMDDLLHENGHHYLNTYLNHVELINEDDEKIYYSPWRMALRPIRGIYHATFTFYWALELFASLNEAIESKKCKFTTEETSKIRFRFVEEFYMLDYCYKDLEHAYKNKKMNKPAFDLIKDIYKIINSHKSLVQKIEKEYLSKDLKKLDIINSLKKVLKEARE